MAELRLVGIEKSFGSTPVLKGVDLVVPDQNFTVFVGPSGCGKSTLLRIIAGLEYPDQGQIFLDGYDITRLPPGKRQLGMVFQSYALYPHMSVYNNLAFGLKRLGHSKKNIDQKVDEVAEILQIQELLDRKPRQLSGGQRQRVAIGRALIREPRIILLDEPLSNLDAALRVQMRVELAKLRHRLGATMIYVTHDQVEAMTLADQLVVMNQGHVEQMGSPLSLYKNPTSMFVAGFIGSPQMNLIPARMQVSPGDIHATIHVDGMMEPSSFQIVLAEPNDTNMGLNVFLGIRPEHLHPYGIQTSLNLCFNGQVCVIEHLGKENLIYVSLEMGTMVTAVASSGLSIQPGDRVAVGCDVDDVYLFNSQGRRIDLIDPSSVNKAA